MSLNHMCPYQNREKTNINSVEQNGPNIPICYNAWHICYGQRYTSFHTHAFITASWHHATSNSVVLTRISHSRWISEKTSSVGSWNLQNGHVFLLLSHGKIHFQWNKCWHGISQTSLPSPISSLHITHSTSPAAFDTSTARSATTAALAAGISYPSFPTPRPRWLWFLIMSTNLLHLTRVSM